MSWAIGYDDNWKRDIGYGVPAICDHPDCNEVIDRGLGHVCGDEPYGGENGCGLYFCEEHEVGEKQQCERCAEGKDPFQPKPDTQEWKNWKLTHESWAQWRRENPKEAAALKEGGDASSKK